MRRVRGMTIRQIALKTQAALLAVATLAAPASAFAGPADTYYERAFVVAADARCNLFQPELARALTAATAQARGAALRSGVAAADLTDVAYRAGARAGSVACADPQLAVVKGSCRRRLRGLDPPVAHDLPTATGMNGSPTAPPTSAPPGACIRPRWSAPRRWPSAMRVRARPPP